MSFPPPIPANARPVQSAWPELTCFGCGPANPDGLHLESYVADDEEALVAAVEPDDRFQITPDIAYGGTVASLVDCHGIWTAMTFRSPPDERPPEHPPARPAVTAELSVTYEAPTPLGEPLYLVGRPAHNDGRRTTVEVELGPAAGVTAIATVEAVSIGAIGVGSRPGDPHVPG